MSLHSQSEQSLLMPPSASGDGPLFFCLMLLKCCAVLIPTLLASNSDPFVCSIIRKATNRRRTHMPSQRRIWKVNGNLSYPKPDTLFIQMAESNRSNVASHHHHHIHLLTLSLSLLLCMFSICLRLFSCLPSLLLTLLPSAATVEQPCDSGC